MVVGQEGDAVIHCQRSLALELQIPNGVYLDAGAEQEFHYGNVADDFLITVTRFAGTGIFLPVQGGQNGGHFHGVHHGRKQEYHPARRNSFPG